MVLVTVARLNGLRRLCIGDWLKNFTLLDVVWDIVE